MVFLLLIVVIVLFFIKNKILDKELLENKRKLWPIYFSSLFAEVISSFGMCIVSDYFVGISSDEIVYFYVIIFICIIENIIFLIVGIVYFIRQKKKLKQRKRKLKNYVLLKVILTFLCICGISFLLAYLPKFFKSDIEKYIENYVEEYMTNKYGNGNFKVLSVKKAYDGGLWEEEVHSGYYINIRTNYLDKPTFMFIDGITKETFEVSYDGLLLDYYEKIDKNYGDITFFRNHIMLLKNKEIEEVYQKKYGLDVDFDIECYYDIPDNYGHIPSIDELVGLCPVKTDYIRVRIDDKVKIKDKLDYLKRFVKYSIDYFNIDEEAGIIYSFGNGGDEFIKISDGNVSIKLYGKENIFTREEIENYS